MLKHMEGLCVFVQHPEVPPDNNAAERTIRGSVTCRYTSFESGSASKALLAIGVFALRHAAPLESEPLPLDAGPPQRPRTQCAPSSGGLWHRP